MARIEFKAKVQTMWNMDDTIAYTYIQVPQLDRKHCDMHAFRTHEKYGGLANSDLFKGVLKGIRARFFKDGWLRLNSVPDGVLVDTSGFLAKVTIDV